MTERKERRRGGRIQRDRMLADVRDGLSREQKELSPKYFYDERGSELFEEITQLAEYYPTEAERALLRETAPALIAELRPCTLVELGAGSASKTRVILDAMSGKGASGRLYIPIDVSADFLADVAEQLRAEYPELEITPAVADITAAYTLPHRYPPTLFAFLGSTLGNFGRDEAVTLLGNVAGSMSDGDSFLLGVDLRKDVGRLEAAYNDSRGITAEFNLNILHVLNKELGSSFDPSAFAHRAFYNPDAHRIEMHLVSKRAQAVPVPAIGDVRFDEGESIRTEVSYKYDRASIEDLFRASGLTLERWMPGDDSLFALVLGTTQR